jgi:hypothetical protein
MTTTSVNRNQAQSDKQPLSARAPHSDRKPQGDQPPHSNKLPPIIANQVPIDADKTTQVWIEEQNSDSFLRCIVTNDRAVTGYDAETEYWYTSTDVSLNDVTQVTLRSASGLYDEEDLQDFVGGYDATFSARQDTGTGDWTEGTYTPTATKKRLYKAVDPDNSSHWLGLLIEQNSSNELTGITWYKQTNTSGTLFGTTPSSLSFSLVTHESNPSTNPAHMASGTWFYIHAG